MRETRTRIAKFVREKERGIFSARSKWGLNLCLSARWILKRIDNRLILYRAGHSPKYLSLSLC